MKRKIQLTIYGIAAVIFLALSIALVPQHVGAKDMIPELNAKLLAALNEFAKKNSLSDKQLESLLGEVVLNSPNMRKGGVGIVDGETFVLLDEKKNELKISGKKWQGEESNKQQIVLTDGRQVFGSVTVEDVSKLKILIFTPSQVRYINLTNNTGGKYARYSK
ncbi:MAG: hypothetical protein Q7J84_08535 [Sulfuricaulis sp.]|nr:hypothetical protein [Sulfuricaulis sp.]